MPKRKIFDLMDSCDFYNIKPLWVGDFGTVVENSKLFHFGHAFEVFSENFELVHAEHAQKKFES